MYTALLLLHFIVDVVGDGQDYDVLSKGGVNSELYRSVDMHRKGSGVQVSSHPRISGQSEAYQF